MVIPDKFSYITIGGRIFAGFGLVVAIFMIQAVLSTLGLNEVVKNFRQYEKINLHSRTILEIERNVMEMQRGVLVYTYSGYTGVVQQVLGVHLKLEKQLTEAKALVNDPYRQDVLRRMIEHFHRYIENFDEAIHERELRDQVVNNQLIKLNDEIGNNLSRMLNTAMASNDMYGAALMGIAQEKLLLAHSDAMEFLNKPDSPLVNNTHEHLQAFAKGLQQLRLHFRDNGEYIAALAKVADLSPKYEQAFMGMVRASRSYMHLVYVVMGGEASELLYLVKELKEYTLRENDRLESQINASISSSQHYTKIISLAAVLLAVLLAGWITRNIAVPIKSMTLALTRLSQGQVDTEIPSKGRSDEIGAMAAAAHLFKEKAHELANASQYKSEFLANMSHELRTPLNSLLILAKMLATNEGGNLTQRQVESARVIHESGKDLLTMIKDILDMSKIESGHMEVLPEQRPLTELGHSIEQMFRPMAANKGLAFLVEITPGLPATLCTDWLKVEQILRNFLANAFKFTEQGKVTLRLQKAEWGHVFITPQLTPGNTVAFTVEDTGIGIPDNKLGQIFEPFRQADGSISRKYGGTGLGLSISRKLAELLGGEIQVVSQEGEGSAFTLYLPVAFFKELAAVQDQARHDPEQQGETEFRDLSRTILLVDDDPRNLFAMQQILQSRVGTLLVARTGREALEILERGMTVDLVFMDIMMPVMSGYDAIQEIRKMPRFYRLPILALTAKVMPGDREKCLQAGASDYMSKPVDSNKLLRILSEWLTATLPPTEKEGLPPPAEMPVLQETISGLDIFGTLRAHGRRLTVLLVDDDMRYAYSIAQILQKKVDKVLMAQDGSKGLTQLARHGQEIDLVLLDMKMPNLDGYATLREMRSRKEWQHIPIIVVTGQSQSGDRQGCLAAGAHDYLTKPVEAEILLQRMAACLQLVASNRQQDDQ